MSHSHRGNHPVTAAFGRSDLMVFYPASHQGVHEAPGRQGYHEHDRDRDGQARASQRHVEKTR